jgi:prepilin-type N-terminal cleavage/methylation domain-containing protein
LAFSKQNKGFTIIELIVVIVIIAVLTGVVMANVSKYSGKSKIARANLDAQNISQAVTLFYAQYGEYPCDSSICGSTGGYFCKNDVCGTGTTGPFITIGGTPRYLSEFYKSPYDSYNASYMDPSGVYIIEFWDDGTGKIGCGSVLIYANDTNGLYGVKDILCQQNPSSTCPCGTNFTELIWGLGVKDYPFQSQSYW